MALSIPNKLIIQLPQTRDSSFQKFSLFLYIFLHERRFLLERIIKKGHRRKRSSLTEVEDIEGRIDMEESFFPIYFQTFPVQLDLIRDFEMELLADDIQESNKKLSFVRIIHGFEIYFDD